MSGEEHDPDDARFEDLGRRAGADLRRPADDDRLVRIAREARRRRATTIAVVGTAVVASFIAVGLVVAPDSDRPTVAGTTSSVATTTSSTESPATTARVTTTVGPADRSTTSSIPPETLTRAVPGVAGTPPTYAYQLRPATQFDSPVVRFLPDGESFLIGDPNGRQEYIVDTDSGEVLRQYPGSEVFGPKLFSPDAKRYFDGRRLWDTASGREVGSWGAFGAAFSPDGARLAIYRVNALLDLVDAEKGSLIWRATGVVTGSSSAFAKVSFSSDGANIIVDDLTYETSTGERTDDSPPPPSSPTNGFRDPDLVSALGGPFTVCEPFAGTGTTECDITVDGRRIAMVDRTTNTVLIWDLQR